jgi:release factor glutamine methyltransferase
LQYLLESVVWRDFTLKVSPGVLIPRPETELFIDLVGETVPIPISTFVGQGLKQMT